MVLDSGQVVRSIHRQVTIRHVQASPHPQKSQSRLPASQQQGSQSQAEAHQDLIGLPSPSSPGPSEEDRTVPPRDFIISPNDYDLNRVIADIDEIRRYNQQRFEMEQLTAIVHEDLERALCVGYKDVRNDEFWVRGHFPTVPLMPGVMMCEAAAQLSSYFSKKYQLLDAEMIGFGGLEEVRFREPVRPGDRLVIAVERVRVRPRAMIVCRFQGLVNDSIVVEGMIKGVPLPVDFLVAAEQSAAAPPAPTA